MELDDTQKQAVTQWIREGAGLSDVQKRLSEELGIAMTYMDVRFLVLDLGVDVQDKVTVAPTGAVDANAAPDAGGPSGDSPQGTMPPPSPGGAGAVTVDVDRLMKPGSLVSGSVTFSDGVSASWALDQMGRLAIDAGEKYTPSEQDIQAFQVELRRVLETRGF